MKRASHYTDTDKLFSMIKKLPIKPKRIQKENGSTVKMSIKLDWIYWNWEPNPDLEEIQKWLDDRKLSIAWDWAFRLYNSDMLFTCLLQE
jgi:hypothetical protein